MTDLSVELLRSQAAQDRHLARVERLLTREGVSLTVADRLSALVDVPVGADDKAIGSAIQSMRRELPGVFAAVPTAERPGEDGSDEWSKGKAEARRRGYIE